MNYRIIFFVLLLIGGVCGASTARSALNHAFVGEWLKSEVSGYEAARVSVFQGCEYIDKSTTCGSSPQYERVTVVEDESVRFEERDGRIVVRYQLLAEFLPPASPLLPRKLINDFRQANFQVRVVSGPHGPQLRGTPPRLVGICALKGVLIELKALAESLNPATSPGAKPTIISTSQELSQLSGLPGYSRCP